MAQRIIKNHTDEEFIISDLGDVKILANGAIDLGGNESRLIELASSDDLLELLIMGTDKIQVSDGLRDLSLSEGLDLIRKIQRATEVDELGRWVVRSDSRRNNWDVVFSGAGDDMITGKMGSGVDFVYDFAAPGNDTRWIDAPAGFKRQRIDWTYSSYVYIKEGTFYFFNMPKGSYIDLWLVSPGGSYFPKKVLDSKQNIVKSYQLAGPLPVPFMHWVVKYHMEGSCPMGDELNTESAAENPAPPGTIFRAEVTIPDVVGVENAHGHWALEVYRASYDPNDDPN